MTPEPSTEELWRYIWTVGEPSNRRSHRLYGLLPSNPRCKLCNAPFQGLGGAIMRLLHHRPALGNPNFCDPCNVLASTHPGGAEVELTLFFADVRGSTTLAEQMSASEFSRLMNRFYAAATDVLVQTDALVDKLVGDEVIGLYVPGFAGAQHARKAVEAAQRLLGATGHGRGQDPWVSIGIGIHTGVAFVGAVRGIEGTATDITALGDTVNTAARIVALAMPGEILVSDAAYAAAGLDTGDLERRELELRGKSGALGVRVLRADAG